MIEPAKSTQEIADEIQDLINDSIPGETVLTEDFDKLAMYSIHFCTILEHIHTLFHNRCTAVEDQQKMLNKLVLTKENIDGTERGEENYNG